MALLVKCSLNVKARQALLHADLETSVASDSKNMVAAKEAKTVDL